MQYIIGLDQSTQGTKALLFDENGKILQRADKKHEQKINEQGWVSHDLNEIYENTKKVIKEVITKKNISPSQITAIGISNQRETTAVWDKSGKPFSDAIVWQCARAKEIAERFLEQGEGIREKTGLPLSPYFPASKMTWLMENVIKAQNEKASMEQEIYFGTIDTWLVYKLTNGKEYKTDYSNASRTQLFNIHTLKWDEELCELFSIPQDFLPQVCDSNSCFGYTTLEGYFDQPVPINSVMGDSHAALFGQGCHETGMVKTTYGTGSSIMMNIGPEFKASQHGLATSLAWGIDQTVSYVLEGNINYTGAVISWLQDDLNLIESMEDLEVATATANPADTTVLIPAFSGLSAPHWKNDAKAMFYGMTRTTRRPELIKAAVESIAFQIKEVLDAMHADSEIEITQLRVDGGPTRNAYLMQFQSDIANLIVRVPEAEELSAIGTAYLAGIAVGVYEQEQLFQEKVSVKNVCYSPVMDVKEREKKCDGWNEALRRI